MDTSVKVVFLLQYYNPHLYPIFDNLAKKEKITLTIGILNSVESFRSGYGWEEAPDSYPYINLWKGKDKRKKFYSSITDAEIIGSLGFFYLRGFSILLSSLLRKKNIVIISEGLKTKGPLKNYLRKIMVFLINSSKVHFLSVGENAYSDYKRFGASKWNAWKFGFVTKLVSNHNIIKNDNPKINLIFVGQLIPRKGCLDLLNTIKNYNLDNKVSLSIIGSGKQDSTIKKFIEINNLSNTVKCKGQIPYSQIIEEMKLSDCLILPSQYDGWGAVLNEAMEAGLAIITSSGVRSAIPLMEDGEPNGYIYDYNDLQGLANFILKLYSDRDLLYNFKLQSKKKHKELWRPSVLANRLHLLVRKITKNELFHFSEGPMTKIS